MSIPALGQSPAAGSRVPVGALAITFALGAGNDIVLTVGSTIGDDDLGTFMVPLPAVINYVVPAGVPVLHLSAWVVNAGEAAYHTYSWVYGVGDGQIAPGQQFRRLVVGHLVDKLKRSELAGYEQGIFVPPAAHGHDEICPVSHFGDPFDLKEAAHIAPFTADQVGAQIYGTGYLRCIEAPLGQAVVIVPGCNPQVRQDFILNIEAVIPSSQSADDLAKLYTGLIAMIFRFVTIHLPDGGYIRNIVPPDEIPGTPGTDGTWHYFQTQIRFIVVSNRTPAGTV